MKLHISLDRVSKFLDQAGYGYEVTLGGALICSGWAGGDVLSAREEARDHARLVLRRQERARLASITGDVE